MAYRILPCQESPRNLFFKLTRYFKVFLKDWGQSVAKASEECEKEYGFTIEEYCRVCCSINAVLLTSNKNYKSSPYEIFYLLCFDVEKLCSNLKKEHSAQTKLLFKKVLNILSTPLEGIEEKVRGNHSNLTELQRFYDYSFFEENYPLIAFKDKYIIPFPYMLIEASWKIMYKLLEKKFGKSKLKDKGQLHFTQALENHLISVAEQLPNLIDSCHVFAENNLNKLGVPETSKKVDLVIEFKDSIFLFECKTIEPDKYLKFSLNRQEFMQGFYGKSLYKALNQLITCSNIIQTAKTNKQSFMFVVTLEELYLPNFQTLKEIILDESLLEFLYSTVCKDEKDKSELASIVDLIKRTNLKNVFFISIHEFNMIINGLKLGKYNSDELCRTLEESSKRNSPFPFLKNYILATIDGQKSTNRLKDPTQELIKNIPFEEINKSTWIDLSEQMKSLLEGKTNA